MNLKALCSEDKKRTFTPNLWVELKSKNHCKRRKTLSLLKKRQIFMLNLALISIFKLQILQKIVSKL